MGRDLCVCTSTGILQKKFKVHCYVRKLYCPIRKYEYRYHTSECKLWQIDRSPNQLLQQDSAKIKPVEVLTNFLFTRSTTLGKTTRNGNI
jgi:hypothetical protein